MPLKRPEGLIMAPPILNAGETSVWGYTLCNWPCG